MGLLSFFSRKSSHENKKLDALKSQPYNATVASLPPVIGTVATITPCEIRHAGKLTREYLGTLPVAGNGPNVLETVRLNRSRDSQAQAPAFVSSKFRSHDPREGEEIGERPRTAPSKGRPQWVAYQRSDSLKAPPVPSVKGPPYRLPDREPGQPGLTSKQRPPYRLPSTVPEPVIFTKPNPAFAHVRPDSVRSRTSSFHGGFVDILDAQSNFIPTDFRHRLLATGARDYGEDVADRNMGENGTNLDSAETRAFYSSNSGDGAPAPTISRSTHDLDQREFRSKKRFSSGSRSRTKSLNSDSNPHHSSQRMSYDYEQPPVLADRRPTHESRSKMEPTSTKADRRRSLPAYAGLLQRKDVHDREVDDFPDTLRIRVRDAAGTSRDTEQNVHIRPRSSHRLSISSKQSRDSAVLVREHRPTSRGTSHGVPSVTREHQPKFTKASRRETTSYAAQPVSNQSPSKRLSLQSIQSSSTHQNTNPDSSRRARPQSTIFDSQLQHSRSGSAANIQDFPSAELHMAAFQSPRQWPPTLSLHGA
jgi:hypothetical protein